jgi:Sigma-70, region 4
VSRHAPGRRQTLSGPLTLLECREGVHLEIDRPRPAVRADCEGGPRPCPWAGCRYHLLLDVNPGSGSIGLVHGHTDPTALKHTCALDLADEGEHTLEEVADALSVTRERIRQIEERGVKRLQKPLRQRGLSAEDVVLLPRHSTRSITQKTFSEQVRRLCKLARSVDEAVRLVQSAGHDLPYGSVERIWKRHHSVGPKTPATGGYGSADPAVSLTTGNNKAINPTTEGSTPQIDDDRVSSRNGPMTPDHGRNAPLATALSCDSLSHPDRDTLSHLARTKTVAAKQLSARRLSRTAGYLIVPPGTITPCWEPEQVPDDGAWTDDVFIALQIAKRMRGDRR